MIAKFANARHALCPTWKRGRRGMRTASPTRQTHLPIMRPLSTRLLRMDIRNLVTRCLVYTESEHTLVEERGTGPLPEGPYLYQNAPNPFNGSTVMRYALEREGTVRLTIYSLGGKRVAQLVDAFQKPGYHQTIWDGRDRHGRALASGVYLARLQAG